MVRIRTSDGSPMAPAFISSLALTKGGYERKFSVTRYWVEARSAAAATRSASAMLVAIGFWQERCLPASSTAMDWPACIWVGVRSSTASTLGSSSTSSRVV